MSDEWNFDMEQAPRGHFQDVTRNIKGKAITSVVHVPEVIIAAGNDGVVTLSKWIEKDQRWNMFTADVPPLAWKPWPAHPATPKVDA